MTVFLLLVLLTLFVAYANGANDNFKGVATLYGANVTGYRTALLIATAATFLGCLASVFVAQELIQAFSGKGLVPEALITSPNFLLAVAAGASGTVILATLLGLPISTTHSLIGALIGGGLMAAGAELDLGVLGSAFFLPLLLSPAIAILLTMPLYKLAHGLGKRFGITKESCVCVAPGQFVPVAALAEANTALTAEAANSGPLIVVGTAPACLDKYNGSVWGLTAQTLVDNVHYASAAAVSFARGLNDGPKIIGLLLAVEALDLRVGMLAIAAAMALGGWLNAHKVAVTMSKKISRMNDGQALTANLVTAFMVIFASRFGLPVSTTHVSVGAIAGIGIVNGSAGKRVFGEILLAWFLTLPVAAAISALAYWLQPHLL